MRKNPMKIAFGDGIFACNPRNFGIFMPKHLAGQWIPNSYSLAMEEKQVSPRSR